MIDEEKDKTFPITKQSLSNAVSLTVFCITGDSPISISSTWHILSGFPVPRGLRYHDQVRRKLQKWHPVIFHAGIKCCFTMKSLVLVYKIQCTSEVKFSYWIQLSDWQIDVHELKWVRCCFEENSMCMCHSCQKFTCLQRDGAFPSLQAVTDVVRIWILSPYVVIDLGPAQ